MLPSTTNQYDKGTHMEQPKKEMKINIKANDAVLGGIYSNNVMVHMNREEFILDFINIVPPNATLGARVILSPSHVKRMLKTLQSSLDKFEQEYGTLPDVQSVAQGGSVQ